MSRYNDNTPSFWQSTALVIGAIAILIVTSIICAGIMPNYWVYSQNLSGQAQLREAEWTKQIRIEDANARYESAALLAKAEVERAKGVAEANKIIGESLKENEAYLRYLWIQGLQDGSSETIYIPTEANIPILEATRRRD